MWVGECYHVGNLGLMNSNNITVNLNSNFRFSLIRLVTLNCVPFNWNEVSKQINVYTAMFFYLIPLIDRQNCFCVVGVCQMMLPVLAAIRVYYENYWLTEILVHLISSSPIVRDSFLCKIYLTSADLSRLTDVGADDQGSSDFEIILWIWKLYYWMGISGFDFNLSYF